MELSLEPTILMLLNRSFDHLNGTSETVHICTYYFKQCATQLHVLQIETTQPILCFLPIINPWPMRSHSLFCS
jgi:hypothetical protein